MRNLSVLNDWGRLIYTADGIQIDPASIKKVFFGGKKYDVKLKTVPYSYSDWGITNSVMQTRIYINQKGLLVDLTENMLSGTNVKLVS